MGTSQILTEAQSSISGGAACCLGLTSHGEARSKQFENMKIFENQTTLPHSHRKVNSSQQKNIYKSGMIC